MTDNRKILITKISKRGFSQTVGSAFGFGSWTIGETSIEVEINPPIDITTVEGQETYKKLKESLAKMTLKALNEDIEMARARNKELDISITKREQLVNNSLEEE